MTTTDHRPDWRTQTKDGFMCTSEGQGRPGHRDPAGQDFIAGTAHVPCPLVGPSSQRMRAGEARTWHGYRLVVLADATSGAAMNASLVEARLERRS